MRIVAYNHAWPRVLVQELVHKDNALHRHRIPTINNFDMQDFYLRFNEDEDQSIDMYYSLAPDMYTQLNKFCKCFNELFKDPNTFDYVTSVELRDLLHLVYEDNRGDSAVGMVCPSGEYTPLLDQYVRGWWMAQWEKSFSSIWICVPGWGPLLQWVCDNYILDDCIVTVSAFTQPMDCRLKAKRLTVATSYCIPVEKSPGAICANIQAFVANATIPLLHLYDWDLIVPGPGGSALRNDYVTTICVTSLTSTLTHDKCQYLFPSHEFPRAWKICIDCCNSIIIPALHRRYILDVLRQHPDRFKATADFSKCPQLCCAITAGTGDENTGIMQTLLLQKIDTLAYPPMIDHIFFSKGPTVVLKALILAITQKEAPHLLTPSTWVPRAHKMFPNEFNNLAATFLICVLELAPLVDPCVFEEILRHHKLPTGFPAGFPWQSSFYRWVPFRKRFHTSQWFGDVTRFGDASLWENRQAYF